MNKLEMPECVLRSDVTFTDVDYGQAEQQSDIDRAELEAARAGKAIEKTITFVAYVQNGEPNKNFVTFSPEILGELADSFVGVPFLRDHNQQDIASRGGMVIGSRLVDADGCKSIELTAKLTSQWAVVALLEGNIDRFSIGWDHPGLETINCSLCQSPALSECQHLPGDQVDGQTVEFVFTQARAIEVSAVTVPAVAGTGILQFRSDLETIAASKAALKGSNMDKKVKETLGLAESADDSAILAAATTLKAEVEAHKEAVKLANADKEELASQLSNVQSQLAAIKEEQHQLVVDRLFADFADRLPVARNEEGERVPSELEVRLRAVAATDSEAAKGILMSLSSVVVEKPQSLPDYAPEETVTQLTAQQIKLGITPEMINGGKN